MYAIEITELGRPPTINSVYGKHNHYSRARVVKSWREAAAWKWRTQIKGATLTLSLIHISEPTRPY